MKVRTQKLISHWVCRILDLFRFDMREGRENKKEKRKKETVGKSSEKRVKERGK